MVHGGTSEVGQAYVNEKRNSARPPGVLQKLVAHVFDVAIWPSFFCHFTSSCSSRIDNVSSDSSEFEPVMALGRRGTTSKGIEPYQRNPETAASGCSRSGPLI